MTEDGGPSSSPLLGSPPAMGADLSVESGQLRDAEPLLKGVRSEVVTTERGRFHLLQSGSGTGPVVVFVHGNVSSARFFEETMVSLPRRWRCIALDLRGFGRSERLAVDATRGLSEFSEDIEAVVSHASLGLADEPLHLVGWSLGGGVVMQYLLDHPARVASVTLESTMSPYGFGGTRGPEGSWCTEDAAGSGAAAVAPELVRRLAAGDRSLESPFSPRMVMRSRYFHPPFQPAPEREEVFVTEMLRSAVGEDNYPGTAAHSRNWPGVAPGTRGVVNAISPRYCNLSSFGEASLRCPVLWIRGAEDQIVADLSPIDFGVLGRSGIVPGWPGEEFPPQPMIQQISSMLARRSRLGGTVVEALLDNCGHSPHLEQPVEFEAVLTEFVGETVLHARLTPAEGARTDEEAGHGHPRP